MKHVNLQILPKLHRKTRGLFELENPARDLSAFGRRCRNGRQEGPGCKQKSLYAVYMCTRTILMHGTRPAGVKRLRAEELVRPSIGEMHASDAHVPCPHLPTGRIASTCAGAFRHIRQGCRLEGGGRERCDPRGTDVGMHIPACKHDHGQLCVAGVHSVWPPVGRVAGLCPNAAGGGLPPCELHFRPFLIITAAPDPRPHRRPLPRPGKNLYKDIEVYIYKYIILVFLKYL